MNRYLILVLLSTALSACESDFLDARPRKSLLVPSTTEDMEALLNNSREVMNVTGYHSLVSDGDFRIDESILPYLAEGMRIHYAWSDATTNWIGDWDYAYKQIFYANVVLEGLKNQKSSELRGRALFYRAWALHFLVQQFAAVYDPQTAASVPGVPCPLTADINNKPQRGTLEETYRQIFDDLSEADGLLPETPVFSTQPSRVAVQALLARLHLIRGEYPKALQAADQSLSIQDGLLDYNSISTTLAASFPLPFVSPNPEILYYAIGNTSFTGSTYAFADTSLYNLYGSLDRRKALLFNAALNFKGSYTGSPTPFTGLATDEVYLIKAECLVRTGDTPGALGTLNYFRRKRYSPEASPVTETVPEKLLKLILEERRKELVARGTTWMDLRRLNGTPGLRRSLTRVIAGETYTLEPQSSRFVMKIPGDEVIYSGIEQNP
jgi:hypothetical protein